jgi:hypothetical protein
MKLTQHLLEEKVLNMKLTQHLLEEKFLAIIDGIIAFEEASSWAYKMMKKDELGELEYDRDLGVSKLFSALTYLAGLSTETSPNTYLYNVEDVKIEYNQIFGP